MVTPKDMLERREDADGFAALNETDSFGYLGADVTRAIASRVAESPEHTARALKVPENAVPDDVDGRRAVLMRPYYNEVAAKGAEYARIAASERASARVQATVDAIRSYVGSDSSLDEYKWYYS